MNKDSKQALIAIAYELIAISQEIRSNMVNGTIEVGMRNFTTQEWQDYWARFDKHTSTRSQ